MTLNSPGLFPGDRVMVMADVGAATRYELKEAIVQQVDTFENVFVEFADGSQWWFARSQLMQLGAPVRDIIHRERIMDMSAHGSYDPKLLQPVDIAYARGLSWIKRNLREWPYGYELACEATAEELIFWFQKVEDY